MTFRINTLIFILLFAFSCRKTSTEPCDDSSALHKQADFPIGVAVDLYELENHARYREITEQQFNSITPENIFKPSYLRPDEQTFFWDNADRLVSFCQSANKRLHGHTLIWHKQLPYWMEHFQGSKDEWEAMFKTHIQNICSHFRGKIRSWDVLNEAFNDDGTLRNSIWKQHLGSAYIEKAFRYAHETDPDALLFYNDYDLVMNEKKRQAVLGLLTTLRQRGVPIHGVGMQMHVSIRHPANSQIAKALKEVSDAGFRVHLSEIDISVNPTGKENIDLNDQLLQRQADKMAFVVKAYKELPKHHQYGLTFWGVSDRNSWIRTSFNREDYPLLYDDDFETKPVYCKLKEAL